MSRISFEIRFAPFLSNAFSWIYFICLVTPNISLVMPYICLAALFLEQPFPMIVSCLLVKTVLNLPYVLCLQDAMRTNLDWILFLTSQSRPSAAQLKFNAFLYIKGFSSELYICFVVWGTQGSGVRVGGVRHVLRTLPTGVGVEVCTKFGGDWYDS